MTKILLSIFLTLFCFNLTFAQAGGDNTYEFLNLPNGSRIASLGGNNVSHYDNDLNFVLNNPALLRSEMNNKFTLNFVNYLSDINFGYASYAKEFKNIGVFGAGIQYINYGKFLNADETGVINGDFTPSEYSFNLYYAKPLNERFNVGASLKTIYSSFYSYFSSGIAIDAGLSYRDTAHSFSAGLVVKNFGIQLKPYTVGNREPLPFDVQIGITQGLKHAPFRFSITAQDLLKWNLSYDSPFSNSYVLNAETDKNFFNKLGDVGDEVMRHFIVGVELVPIKNFYVALGYNYRRRTELSISTMPKLVGMSVGFGIQLSKFNISYGLASKLIPKLK
jgi:hypothetical protein